MQPKPEPKPLSFPPPLTVLPGGKPEPASLPSRSQTHPSSLSLIPGALSPRSPATAGRGRERHVPRATGWTGGGDAA
jgi:hypothetical protein